MYAAVLTKRNVLTPQRLAFEAFGNISGTLWSLLLLSGFSTTTLWDIRILITSLVTAATTHVVAARDNIPIDELATWCFVQLYRWKQHLDQKPLISRPVQLYSQFIILTRQFNSQIWPNFWFLSL
jgi:hypothetical protein